MYPVTLGYDEAKKRIESLLRDGYCSEALVTAVFTAEKMLRRTLRQIIVSAGFTSNINFIKDCYKCTPLTPKNKSSSLYSPLDKGG